MATDRRDNRWGNQAVGQRSRRRTSFGAVVLLVIMGLTVAACGGPDAEPTKASTAQPSPVATAPPTSSVRAPTPSAEAAPTSVAEEVSNPFGLKVGAIRSISSGDANKLTLPAPPDKIDKLGPFDSWFRIGITDGVVVAPVDGRIMVIETIKDTAFGPEARRATLLLANAQVLRVWVAGNAVFQVKEGDSVVRGSVLCVSTTRLQGLGGDGYTTAFEYASENLNRTTSWAGDRPSAYVR